MEKENFFVQTTPKDVPGKKLYCGPTVIAMLTGATREEIFAKVNRRINQARKKYGGKKKRTKDMVKGMYNHHLEIVLKRFGVKLSKHHKNTNGKYAYGSLRQFVDDYGHIKKPAVVNVTGHYVVFFRGKVYDTYRREGVEVKDHPCAGKRVESYWIVEKQPTPGVSLPEPSEAP